MVMVRVTVSAPLDAVTLPVPVFRVHSGTVVLTMLVSSNGCSVIRECSTSYGHKH